MARVALVAAFLNGPCQAVTLPDTYLGTWRPIGNHSAVAAILGPVENPTFTMAHNKRNGDYWMSFLTGQVFRVRTTEEGEDVMQYCFAHVATSPFLVDTIEDNLIRFCYNGRMESHKVMDDGSLAMGCDAAKIELELHENGQLELSFYMSPPIRHAWAVYERTGDSPSIASYIAANVGGACDPLNPGPPTEEMLNASPCPVINYKRQQLKQALPAALPEREGTVCRRYNHGALRPSEDDPNRMDVQLQYTVPEDSCWPCNVTYAVSAAIAEDEYIGFGFKGVGYRKELLPGPDGAVTWNVTRPGYFGMSKDDFDLDRTQAGIVLGYAGSASSCLREMKAETYAGTPTDVEGNPNLFDASVERVNGRTVMHFTVEQKVGQTDQEISQFFNAEQLSQRTMWAIGSVDGAGCDAKIKFHRARGISPLAWFAMTPKVQCDSAAFGFTAVSV